MPYNDNTPMPFGKYKGKPLITVPAAYLLWLFDKGLDQGPLKQYITDNLDALKKEVGR